MKYLIASALALTCTLASAYTECPNTEITRIYKDVNGNFFLGTVSYLNGRIDPSDKVAIAMVITAYTSGKRMMIRYARDGVSCTGAVWDEAISGVSL